MARSSPSTPEASASSNLRPGTDRQTADSMREMLKELRNITGSRQPTEKKSVFAQDTLVRALTRAKRDVEPGRGLLRRHPPLRVA